MIEKDAYCLSHLYVESFSLTCGIFKKVQDYRYMEQIVVYQGKKLGVGAKLVMGIIKRYKLLVLIISHGDVMYSMVTIVHNIVLHI